MRLSKYIWILIIIYIVCSARTCNESEESTEVQKEEYTMNLMNSVISVFSSESLPDRLLRAYEISAEEKLNDFADYMKIISDTTLDLRFRHHAAELVRDLFISEETDLSGWSKSYPEPGLDVLKQLLSYSLSEGVQFWLKPIDVNIIKPFTCINDSTFSGNLSFIYRSPYYAGKDTSEIASGTLLIDIFLRKEARFFGKEQFRVWKVYLGNMNEYSEN